MRFGVVLIVLKVPDIKLTSSPSTAIGDNLWPPALFRNLGYTEALKPRDPVQLICHV